MLRPRRAFSPNEPIRAPEATQKVCRSTHGDRSSPVMWPTFVIGLFLGLASLPAAEGGYWFFTEAPDGAKGGVVFPDYSPNDFVGMVIVCAPGSNRLDVYLDLPQPVAAGRFVGVEFVTDDLHTSYRGQALAVDAEGGIRARFSTSADDPIVTAIASASKLGYVVDGHRIDLPVEMANSVLSSLQTRCAASSGGVSATPVGASSGPQVGDGSTDLSTPPISDDVKKGVGDRGVSSASATPSSLRERFSGYLTTNNLLLAGVVVVFTVLGSVLGLVARSRRTRRVAAPMTEPTCPSTPADPVSVVPTDPAEPPPPTRTEQPRPPPPPSPPPPPPPRPLRRIHFCTECGARIEGYGPCPCCGTV